MKMNADQKMDLAYDKLQQAIVKVKQDAFINFIKEALEAHGHKFDTVEEMGEFLKLNATKYRIKDDPHDIYSLMMNDKKKVICAWRDDYSIKHEHDGDSYKIRIEFSRRLYKPNKEV